MARNASVSAVGIKGANLCQAHELQHEQRVRQRCERACEPATTATLRPSAIGRLDRRPSGAAADRPLSQLRHYLGGWDHLGDLAYSLPHVQRHGLDMRRSPLGWVLRRTTAGSAATRSGFATWRPPRPGAPRRGPPAARQRSPVGTRLFGSHKPRPDPDPGRRRPAQRPSPGRC
jgi:hypothetical protein